MIRSRGRRISNKEFAEYLGVGRVSLTQWLSGAHPDPENIHRIAGKLGLEIFDALDLPRPKSSIRELQSYYDATPPEHRDWLLGRIEEILIEQGWLLASESPNLDDEWRDDD